MKIKKETLLKGTGVLGIGGAGLGIGTLLVKPTDKDQLIIFQKENENLKKLMEDMQADNTKHSEEQTTKIEEITTQNEALQGELDKLNETAKTNEKLQQEVETLKEQLKNNVPEVDWADVRDKFEANKTENRALKKQVEQLKKTLGEYDASETRIARLNSTIQTLEDTITDLGEENDRLNSELDLEKKIVKTLDADRNKKDARITELEKQLRDVSDAYDMTNTWVDQLENRLNYWLKEVENLKEKLATYQKMDPQNYRKNNCRLGLGQGTEPTQVSVACSGWFDSKGEFNKDITVQLFFEKDKVGAEEFQKWVNRYKQSSQE